MLQTTKTHELAWAAGFFDGEGSTDPAIQKWGNARLRLQINQVVKSNLDRFQSAVGGLGKIYGPYRQSGLGQSDFWRWQTSSAEHGQAVVALLWKFLAPAKKEQMKSSVARMNSYNADRRATSVGLSTGGFAPMSN